MLSTEENVPFRWKKVQWKVRFTRLLCCLAIGGVWCAWRWVEPYYYLTDRDFCDNFRVCISKERDEERLAEMGSRAIDPILGKIKERDAYYWENAALLHILKQQGEPAHQRLLSWIDHNASVRDRIRLVYALQTSFDDYSRVNLWLDYVQCPFVHYSDDLRKSLMDHFPEVPAITDDQGMLREEFVDWYQKRSAWDKTLPKYDCEAQKRYWQRLMEQ